MAYYDGYEWVGSLRTLEPGKGYMTQSGKDASFNYPTSTTPNAASRAAVRSMVSSEPQAFVPVDYHRFNGNMIVLAQVVYNALPVAGAEVGFFVDDECREAAVTDAEGRIYVTIPGSEPCQLTVLVNDGNRTMQLTETIDYSTDAICGAPRAPYIIDLSSPTGIVELYDADVNAETVYDLAGRRVKVDGQQHASGLNKGVYIVNGQKKIRK